MFCKWLLCRVLKSYTMITPKSGPAEPSFIRLPRTVGRFSDIRNNSTTNSPNFFVFNQKLPFSESRVLCLASHPTPVILVGAQSALHGSVSTEKLQTATLEASLVLIHMNLSALGSLSTVHEQSNVRKVYSWNT